MTTRAPAVAGTFYPAPAPTLARMIEELLATADAGAKPVPKALIAPHAGYIYSGATAAHAYARLKPGRERITRVVLLGPVHRVPIRGLALPSVDSFATPLGTIPLDREAMQRIGQLPQVGVNDRAHALEHSLEVHLPFLQNVLQNFALVPLAVGDATPQEVAEVIDALWGGPETLIVVSSDLSHFLPYAAAQRIDHATAQAILQLDIHLNHEQACGGTPVNGLMLAARRHHLKPELLDLRNSGDTAGDKARVVGYAAFAFTEENGEENLHVH